ncbi:hypothetical protein [Cellulosimicrobium cellulans]|uniref:hypothetical protein n=1 Tax=Cellulosimicrobium cellulans TaxID=1710 RepID=UPI000849536D|nr:hypothetical protein [Cellulosimicrobium cellulans]
MSTDERTVRTGGQQSRRSVERTGDVPASTWLPSVTRFSPERRAEIAAALRSGDLVRARQGVYVRPPDRASSPAGRRREAVVASAVALAERLTTAFWFSHSTAAVLHGLWTWRLADEVHVTQLGNPSVRRRADPGVRRHWTALADEDRDKVGGLPVTSLERTIVDCARSLPPVGGIVVADSGLRAGADVERLGIVLEAAAGGRGVRRARQVLAEADGRSESPGESVVRWIAVEAGLPRPEPNVTVPTWRGAFRLDLAWTAHRVAAEFDGAVKYSGGEYGDPQRRLLAEKARHDALVEAGWLVLRVTWDDLADPDVVVRRIRSALATASRRRASEIEPAVAR